MIRTSRWIHSRNACQRMSCQELAGSNMRGQQTDSMQENRLPDRLTRFAARIKSSRSGSRNAGCRKRCSAGGRTADGWRFFTRPSTTMAGRKGESRKRRCALSGCAGDRWRVCGSSGRKLPATKRRSEFALHGHARCPRQPSQRYTPEPLSALGPFRMRYVGRSLCKVRPASPRLFRSRQERLLRRRQEHRAPRDRVTRSGESVPKKPTASSAIGVPRERRTGRIWPGSRRLSRP